MEANYKKKLLSMFLVLALCLSMIPTSAMAEEAAGGSAAAGQEELTTGDPAGAETPSECLSLDAPESITYTEDLTITANVTTEGAVTYKWFEDDTELIGQTGGTLTLKDTPRKSPYTTNPEPAEYGNVGDHTFKCEASIDGATVSKEVTVTVKPADLSNAELTINGEDGLAYYPFSSKKDSGSEQRIVFDLWYNNKYLTLRSDDPTVEPTPIDYTVTGNKGVTDAGTYTLTVTGQGNYTGTKSIQFVVKPCELSEKAAIGNLGKDYDGTTDLPLRQLDFVGFLYEGTGNTINFDRDVDYTVEGAQFENADVGNSKTVIIKFRMLNPNYSFAGGQREIVIVRSQKDAGSTWQEIVKAAAADQSVDLEVMNGHAKTYNVDLAELIPELTAPKQYGDITYGQPVVQLDTGYYAAGGAKVENGVLSLPIKQVDTKAEGEIGTVKVVVRTTNYKDMTLTVNVKATNKLIPTGAPTLSKSSLTYGETLGNMKLSGSMKYGNAAVEGTFAWDTPDAKPAATAAYAAKWTFIPNDGTRYQTVKGTTEIPVNKATPAGEPVYTRITAAGKTVTAAVLAVNPGWPAGTVKWVDADGKQLDDSTEVKVNTAYRWLFTPTDTNNYNEATGTIVLYMVSSFGGGSSSSSDSTTTKTETKSDGIVVETTTDKDGTVTKTETKTETKMDGTKVETKTRIETKKDGTVTETKTEIKTDKNGVTTRIETIKTTTASGSTGTTTTKTDATGTKTEAEVKVSEKDVTDAKKSSGAVEVPTKIKAEKDGDAAPTVKVELPKNAGKTKIEIPVENVSSGTVAVIVKPDGTEEIVKDSIPTESGIRLTLDGNAMVKVVDYSKDFVDTRNHWAKEAIDFVYARGLVNGISTTRYAPNSTATRAQIWAILARQNDANWKGKKREWVMANGISNGRNPNGIITRAQMITMLWRVAGSPVVKSKHSFTDVPARSYYAKAVAWAVENGITTGVGGGKFRPKASCTRAQIAVFLYRTYPKS